MSSSPDEVAAQFDTAKKLVEDATLRPGLEPAKVRGEGGANLASWCIRRGSASTVVSVSKSDRGDAAYLRAISPVMSLPPERGPLDFFRRLLEPNGQGLVNAAFGIMGDEVVVKSERPTDFLDPAGVEQIILHLSAVADTYDDRLVRELGGQRASDLGAP